MNTTKGNTRSIGMILGVLAVLAIMFFAFRGCVGGNNVPVTGNQTGNQQGGQQGQLGQAFVASGVNQSGCPLDREDSFAANQPVYVGFERSQIPAGTEIFARLSRDGRELEDTNPITADRAMTSCVWFAFQPGPNGFEPGDYEVEFFINGNRSETIDFNVSGQGGGNNDGLLSGGNAGGNAGNTGNAQLGDLVITDRVNNDGCPSGEVDRFDSSEPVYAALERSEIPAGTSMFFRLSADGQTVEDTKRITADQNMDTCVWFMFESSRTGGLQPGDYEVQVFVNGNPGPSREFSVR